MGGRNDDFTGIGASDDSSPLVTGLLLAGSIFLIIITMPFSLFMCIKVVQVPTQDGKHFLQSNFKHQSSPNKGIRKSGYLPPGPREIWRCGRRTRIVLRRPLHGYDRRHGFEDDFLRRPAPGDFDQGKVSPQKNPLNKSSNCEGV